MGLRRNDEVKMRESLMVTMEDVGRALATIEAEKINCRKKHNYNITGGCTFCMEFWLGKKDHENVKSLLKIKEAK